MRQILRHLHEAEAYLLFRSLPPMPTQIRRASSALFGLYRDMTVSALRLIPGRE